MLIKGIPKFLINPAMNAPTDIENAIGLGEHDFLRPRQDGAVSYTIDRGFIDELEILLKGYNSSSYDFQKKLSAFSAEMTSCFTMLICSGRNSVRKIC